MRISICGLGRLSFIGDPELATSIPVISFLHGEPERFMREAWGALKAAGLESNSVVEVVATVTVDCKKERQPYAVLTSDGKEKVSKVQIVIEHLRTVGLDVELPERINFWHKK